jgi:hypothetical protein
VRVYPILPRPLPGGRITFYKGIVEDGETNNGFCIKMKEMEKDTYYGICMRSSEYSGEEYRPKLTIAYNEATNVIVKGGYNIQAVQFRKTPKGVHLYLPYRGAHTIIITDLSGRIITKDTMDNTRNGLIITDTFGTGTYIVRVQEGNRTVTKKWVFVK